jgi:hypothetical protein
MGGRDKGSNILKKNRMGPAPSSFAASTSSWGMVLKNCRNKNVAVADAIKGKVSPEKVLIQPKEAMT